MPTNSLTGRKRKDTYTWLMQMQGDGSTLHPSTPVTLCFGDGTATPVSMTTTGLFVGGLAVATYASGGRLTTADSFLITGGDSVLSVGKAMQSDATPSLLIPDIVGGSATMAFRSDITGINSGTNTGDETAAAFGPKISTAGDIGAIDDAADKDAFAVLDQSTTPAFGLKKLSFANLKTWLGTWLDAVATIAGAKAFSGQMQLTAQSATDANSAMTRGLVDSRAATVIADFDYATTTAAGAIGGSGSWTWTPPATAKLLRITCVAPGAGGGSGRCGAAGTDRSGGGGGAGGGITISTVATSYLTNVSGALTITIPVGGVGGVAVTASDTNGNNGSPSANPTTVANGAMMIAYADMTSNGSRGSGGTTTAGNLGAASGTCSIIGQSGTAGSNTAGGGRGMCIYAGGGTGGGGCNAANAIGRGGTSASGLGSGYAFGGAVTGTPPVNGADGGVGTSPSITPRIPTGESGYGGNGGYTVAGGAGRNGVRGGGGGGGGGGTNGLGSGAGGNGGDGFVRIECEF